MVHNKLSFNILDALSVASLPREHLVSAIAAYLLSDEAGFPNCTSYAQKIAELFANNEEDEEELIQDIITELKRQLTIKVDRIRTKRLELAARMGAQLGLPARINRVCKSIFGNPMDWSSTRSLQGQVSKVHFNWLYRDQHGVRISGFDALLGGVSVTGVAFRVNGETSYSLLPSRARSFRELVDYYRLGKRLHDDPTVEIDWVKESLQMRPMKDLPWQCP